MIASKLHRPALAAALVLGVASLASAQATIDGPVVATASKGNSFLVSADVTMFNKGVVTLTGSVNGEPFAMTKKFKTKAGKTKTSTVTFKVKLKKLGLRDLDTTAALTCVLGAAEGEAVPVEMAADAVLLPPLLIVPGTANELNVGAYDPFRDQLNEVFGDPWITTGKRASIKVLAYNSLSVGPIPLETLGDQIAKQTLKVIKKSSFSKCDIVAHSMGGFVVRQAMTPPRNKKAPSLRGKVRNAFFMGVANAGTPVAFLAERAIEAADALGVDPATLAGPLLAGVDNPTVADLAQILLNKSFIGVVRQFLPTYSFAYVPTTTERVTLETLTLGAEVPPLRALNAVPPDPDASYHALQYSDVEGATGDVRTVTYVDLSAFLAGGSVDLADVVLLNDMGDGVTPFTSAVLDENDDWAGTFQVLDLGMGTHTPPDAMTPGYWNDPQVFGYLLGALR